VKFGIRELLILLGSISFVKNQPKEGCFYGRQCTYLDACVLKPHDILNAKKASGKLYCVTEYAICDLVFVCLFSS
jgi:hypothetical protein